MVVLKRSAPSSYVDANEKYKREKIAEITACLEKKEVNLWQLRELSLTRGGLINNDLRKRSWHKLMGINRTSLDVKSYKELQSNSEAGVSKADMELIAREVGRAVYFRYRGFDAREEPTLSMESHSNVSGIQTSVSSYPDNDMDSLASSTNKENYYNGQSQSRRRSRMPSIDYSDCGSEYTTTTDVRSINTTEQQNFLSSIITSAISATNVKSDSTRMHYYQGFHDVASVILINMPNRPELAAKMLHKLTRSHLRDAMREDFSAVASFLEIAFYPLLQIVDEQLHDYLIFRELGPAVFLNWIITLFSHDIHDSKKISRLFDAFLASHPLMPLYFSIAILVHPESREQIFDTDEDDPAMLHVVISNLASSLLGDFEVEECEYMGFTIQNMIDTAIQFMLQVPPDSLLTSATHYDLGQSATLLKRGRTLSLFQPPPSWAVAPTAPADWVQRKERRSGSNNPMKKAHNLNVHNLHKSDILGREGIISLKKSDRFYNAKVASGAFQDALGISQRTNSKVMSSFDLIRRKPTMKNFVKVVKVVLGMKKRTRRKRIYHR